MDLLEARPALSFACGMAEWKVWLREMEARFAHRLVDSPFEKPDSTEWIGSWGS